MGKWLTVKQTAQTSGLSEYTLRRGIASGRFPHIRTNGPGKGRILIDLDLLGQQLEQEAKDSIADKKLSVYGIRAVVE